MAAACGAGQPVVIAGTTTTEDDRRPPITTTTIPQPGVDVAILSGPNIVQLTQTSFAFEYETNNVCSTGSFTVTEVGTGQPVGSYESGDGCFGNRYEGHPGLATDPRFVSFLLKPETEYELAVTASGAMSDDVKPTGEGTVAATTRVTTLPPGVVSGSFRVNMPAERELDEVAGVWQASVTAVSSNRVGGRVDIVLESGACQQQAGQSELYIATETGTCVFLATQQAISTHIAAPAQRKRVAIVKPRGSVELIAPNSVLLNTGFSLSETVVGGPISASIDGGCTQGSSFAFTASSVVETCTITVSQEENATHRPALDQIVVVNVVTDLIGSFTVTNPSPVVIGNDFTIATTLIEGGALSIEAAPGDCGPLATGSFRAPPAAPDTCTFTISQAETSTHLAGPSQTIDVAIIPRGPGEFTAIAPPSAVLGQSFGVITNLVAGGPLSATATGGCTETATAFIFQAPATAGSCRITVSQGANATHDPQDPINLTVTIVKPSGAFTLTTPPSADRGVAFQVFGTAMIGGDVTITSLDQARCPEVYIDEYQGASIGACRFVATQEETAAYAPGPEREVTVQIVRPTCSFSATPEYPYDPALYIGDEIRVNITSCTGAGQITTVVSGECSVDTSSGRFFADNLGSCNFLLTQEDNAEWAAGPAQSFEITVIKPPGSFTLPPVVLSSSVFDVIPVVTAGGAVSYFAHSGECVRVGGTGLRFEFMPATSGSVCIITAQQAENADYSPGPNQSVTVVYP